MSPGGVAIVAVATVAVLAAVVLVAAAVSERRARRSWSRLSLRDRALILLAGCQPVLVNVDGEDGRPLIEGRLSGLQADEDAVIYRLRTTHQHLPEGSVAATLDEATGEGGAAAASEVDP